MLIKNSDNIKMVDNEAWNKTHNAKEIAECFSVNTSTVYRLEKQMRETATGQLKSNLSVFTPI